MAAPLDDSAKNDELLALPGSVPGVTLCSFCKNIIALFLKDHKRSSEHRTSNALEESQANNCYICRHVWLAYVTIRETSYVTILALEEPLVQCEIWGGQLAMGISSVTGMALEPRMKIVLGDMEDEALYFNLKASKSNLPSSMAQ